MSGAEKASDIDFEAAAWAVRLETGDLTDAENQALEAWLARDPRCVGALVRAQAIWLDIDRVASGEEVVPPAPRRTWFEPRRVAAAAAFLLVAVFGYGTYDYFDGRLSSARGEIRRIALEDGSSLTLNSASVVRVRYRSGVRHVELRRGEASFQVAHDTARPFVVSAGSGVAVRAVGTSFAVRLQPEDVSVLVDEGTVEVTRAAPDTPSAVEQQMVTRDETVVVGVSNIQKARLDPREMTRRLAWREGLLIFDGQRLSDAAVEINRYADKPIVIDDKRLADKVLVGAFRLGDSKTFANSVVAAYSAKLSERNGALHLAMR